MDNKSLIKKLVEAFDFGKLKPKNLTVQQSTMNASLLRMNVYNQELLKTVDLGLPSRTLWCKFNVGANSETEYGDYFAWGETEPKAEYTRKTYKYKIKNSFIKYIKKDNKYAKKDNLTLLLPEDDAATVNMGKYWCMPTREQLQELKDNTTSKWVEDYKGSGVNGMLFISKFNGNTLFFPAAGGYEIVISNNSIGSHCEIWSSTLNSDEVYGAYVLGYTFSEIDPDDTYLWWAMRYDGNVVRAVFNG